MRVLFIDTVHPILEERLTEKGFDCVDGTKWNRPDIMSKISSYQGVVIRSKFTIDDAFLDAATDLKFIARSGSGLENIDLIKAEEKGIRVFNSPEGNQDAVGEQAVGMLIALMNNLMRSDAEVRNGLWRREANRGHEIKGKTVGIIGYGHMGSAFAQRLKGFGCRVVAYDKYKTNFSDEYAEEVSLQHLMRYSDIVSFHLPYNDETSYYFNNGFIKSMDKPFYLLNTSRGKVVRTDHLVEGLKSGKVIGAALDVLEYEPASFENIDFTKLPDSFTYLKESDRVVLSPHIAGWTVESYIKLSTFLADKILAEFSASAN